MRRQPMLRLLMRRQPMLRRMHQWLMRQRQMLPLNHLQMPELQMPQPLPAMQRLKRQQKCQPLR
jgi:hypothetical protein